jgi:anthranilate phosphoribosyltransferase
VAGKATSLKDGVAMAREAIASGAAKRALETLVAASNG